MSTFRKHFRVAWNDGEPIDIVTNARDLAEASEHSGNATSRTFAIVHAALARNGVAVPDLNTFIDQLDSLRASPNGIDSESADPIQGSTAEPLPYPSLPVRPMSNG